MSGRLKNRDTIHVRMGRILAAHPQVADLYQVAVQEEEEEEEGGPLRLERAKKEREQQWREAPPKRTNSCSSSVSGGISGRNNRGTGIFGGQSAHLTANIFVDHHVANYDYFFARQSF